MPTELPGRGMVMPADSRSDLRRLMTTRRLRRTWLASDQAAYRAAVREPPA